MVRADAAARAAHLKPGEDTTVEITDESKWLDELAIARGVSSELMNAYPGKNFGVQQGVRVGEFSIHRSWRDEDKGSRR